MFKFLAGRGAALAVGSALLLTGCGGGDNEDNGAVAVGEVTDAPQVTDSAADTTGRPTPTPERTTTTEAPTTVPETTAAPTTTEPPVGPAGTLSSPYLQGTLDVELPAGEPGKVSVVAVGPIRSSTAVVVRNNTKKTIEVHLTATARDASGALAGSGEDQGLEPAWVEPGHLAIGYVYLGIDDPQAGITLDIKASGEPIDDDGFGGSLPATIVEHNLVEGQYSPQVVGIVQNDQDRVMEGPINVQVLCFDEAGNVLSDAGGYTDGDAIPAGQQASFSVDIFGDAGCPRYLIGASGYTF